MEVQVIEVDRAHVEEDRYNLKVEEWEVQCAIVDWLGWTSDLGYGKIIPECLDYEGCWSRFETCREFPQNLTLTDECLENHFAST